MPTPQPQIADVFTEPELIRKVDPAYPQAALAADLRGDVILEGLVGVDGKVRDIIVVRSVHPLLDATARKAWASFNTSQLVATGHPNRVGYEKSSVSIQAGVNRASHNLRRATRGERRRLPLPLSTNRDRQRSQLSQQSHDLLGDDRVGRTGRVHAIPEQELVRLFAREGWLEGGHAGRGDVAHPVGSRVGDDAREQSERVEGHDPDGWQARRDLTEHPASTAR